jgi:hypothetical protein
MSEILLCNASVLIIMTLGICSSIQVVILEARALKYYLWSFLGEITEAFIFFIMISCCVHFFKKEDVLILPKIITTFKTVTFIKEKAG